MQIKIKHKLFFALIIANLFIIVGLFILVSWSFARNFRDYLDDIHRQQLQPLVAAMADKYREHGNWDWITDPLDPSWRLLMQQYVIQAPPPDFQGPPPEHRNGGSPDNANQPEFRPNVLSDARSDARSDFRSESRPDAPPQFRPPPPERPQAFLPPVHRALLVKDREKRLILGRPDPKDQFQWLDITLNNQVIGYLGFQKTTQITAEIDRVFMRNLKSNLRWSLLLVIAISAVIAISLAQLLVKPILKLREATKAISGGDYQTRIKVNSRDEIGELCADFNRLAKALDDNLTIRQQWIADISHELRTPVAILQGEIEAIQDGIRSADAKSIDSLHQEITRLSRLIDDLHQLSMSDSGALNYQFKPVAFKPLVQQVLDDHQGRINQCDATVDYQTDDDPLTLMGDTHRLKQMLINLLNNSLAYSTPPVSIRITIQREADALLMQWSDSAPGVSDAQLDKLFERLYRVEGSRNRNQGGSGLGLSISRNIIEAHGGTITAQHSPLGGVTFCIRLPIS